MSDRQSKNNSKARGVFLSRVAERTRSKREAYENTCLGGARGVSSGSQASRAVSAPMAPRKRNASISLGARGVSSGSRAVSAPMAKRKRKASTSLGARGVSSGSQASRAATAPMAPRKRKVAMGRSSRTSKQQHSDDDHRYGYFTPPPEDVSHGSNQGVSTHKISEIHRSDSEDTDSDDDALKIISEAEFKNAKNYTFSAGKDTDAPKTKPSLKKGALLSAAASKKGFSSDQRPKERYSTAKKSSFVVRDVCSDDLSGSVSSTYSNRKTSPEDTTSDSFIQSISSANSSTHSDNDSSTDDGISSDGSGHEIDSVAAGRPPSQTGITKIPSGVRDVSPGSSDGSVSSSTDNDSGDENFEVDDGFCKSDEVELGCSNVEVTARPPVFCSIEVSTAEKSDEQEWRSASKRTTVSKPPSEETNSRKRRLSHDASSKRTKGGKKQKTQEVCEEMSISPTDDTKEDERLKETSNEKKENFTESTDSKNLCAKKKRDEAQGVHDKDQPQHVHIESQKKVDSPSPSNHDSDGSHDNDDDDDDIVEKVDGDRETKKPMTTNQVSPQKYDLCKMLADSVLGRGPVLETKISDEEEEKEEKEEETRPVPQTQSQSTLPLKFKFGDEVAKQVEKTEAEKENEGLFTELEFCWTSRDDLGSFTCPEVDPEHENSDPEETISARCARGKHELVWLDDQGIVCIYCHHVEIGPKDVMPPWAERTYRGQKKKSEMEQPLEFEKLHLKPSNDDLDESSIVANGTVWSIKPSIRESMYEHQQEGFEFLWKNLAGSTNLDELKSTAPGQVGGCIISHAPGTGKTRLTIVFIETYMKLFPNCRPVIIAPAGMLLTWEEEFRKWNVGFPFRNLNNPDVWDEEKKTALGHLATANRRDTKTIRMVNLHSWSKGRIVLGISYSLFEKLTGEKYKKDTGNKENKWNLDSGANDLRKILLEKPGLVILDEGHTPRNQRSNIWNALLKLQTEKRVILSGTPFQNNFSELFNTLRIVRPAVADTLAQEKSLSEMITCRRKYKTQSNLLSEVDDRGVEKLKIAMLPFVHVHKGTILQQSLPGLRDCAVILKPPPLQKSLIEKLEGTPSTFEFEHKSALLSVHPYLLQHSETTDEEKIGIDLAAIEASKLNPNEGVKTKFILEFIRLCMPMNEKVLVFSQYIQPLELIKEQLKEVFKWADTKEILRMQGKLDQRQRQILINRFNDPHNPSKVMLASTRCCSEGISLVGASRVILLDVVWNPSVQRQAISRAYRIGQKKFVYTYHLMTSGTTEADKYCRQAEKERLSELVFTSSSNEINKQTFPCLGIEDKILEAMVDHATLKEMFEKIINQPKDTNLIQSFGITS